MAPRDISRTKRLIGTDPDSDIIVTEEIQTMPDISEENLLHVTFSVNEAGHCTIHFNSPDMDIEEINEIRAIFGRILNSEVTVNNNSVGDF